jgi:DNA-binding CsgD family transcriptional regulator
LKVKANFTLHFRLFMFFIFLVFILLTGLTIILLATGNITMGLKESYDLIVDEHEHLSANISKFYNNISAEAVGLAHILSLNIEGSLREEGLTTNDIKNRPDLIEGILNSQLNHLLLYLNKSKSSGAFIILDTTINNKLPGSDNSKAGLYLKNMEPNIVNASNPTIYLLRGSSKIAYINSIPLHPQWKMEFDVSDAPYFHKPYNTAFIVKDSLSRLYYWCPAFKFPETYEELMICSVPLMDSEGNVFGVCGLDVSSMLFKLSFMPEGTMYQRIICMLSPIENNVIRTDQAMLSGGYTARTSLSRNNLIISKENKNLFTYSNEQATYVGYNNLFKLYSQQSPYSQEQWTLALMVPNEDLKAHVMNENLKLLYLCSFILLSSIATSFILSKHYIKPIYKAINSLKDDSSVVKTNIIEIDELIECLSSKEEFAKNTRENDQDSKILNEFLTNLKTLSPAERSVFNLYAQNYTAKEVADELFLSINTIKTHTKRIYSKLNIKSKDELLLYVEMLKEAGKI